MLASLGVIILLFQVGLESTVGADDASRASRRSWSRPSASSAPSSSAGASAPGCCRTASVYAHVFLGATLTATSVGITARVLKDLRPVADRRSAHHPRRRGDRRCPGPGHPGGGDRHHRRGGSGRRAVVRGDRRRHAQGDRLPGRRPRAGRLRSRHVSSRSPRSWRPAASCSPPGWRSASSLAWLAASSAWRRLSAPSRPAWCSRTCTTATSPAAANARSNT